MSSRCGRVAHWLRQSRTQLSLLYDFCYVLLGLVIAALGPSLLELADNTNSSLATMSIVLIARSCGYLLGSAAGGPLFDRYSSSGNRLLAIAMVLAGGCTAMIPLVTHVALLGIFTSTQGVCMGMLDTGGNVMLLWLHAGHERVEPYMQALHFCFGLGAFVAPLMVGSLADSYGSSAVAFYSMAFFFFPTGIALWRSPSPRPPITAGVSNHNENAATSSSQPNSNRSSPHAHNPKLTITTDADPATPENEIITLTGGAPDGVTATSHQPNTLAAAVAAGMDGKQHQHSSFPTDGSSSTDSIGTTSEGTSPVDGDMDPNSTLEPSSIIVKPTPPHSPVPLVANHDEMHAEVAERRCHPKCSLGTFTPRERSIIALTCLLLCFYVGSEVTEGSYLYTYAVKRELLNPHAASMLNAAFWGSLAFGRLVAIPVSICLSSEIILLVSLIGCLAALAVTISALDNLYLLWIGTVMSGMFMSSIFPTMMTLAEHYLGSLSGRIASLFVIGASTGEMAMPVIVAVLFDRYGLWTLFYALAVNSVISTFIFVLLVCQGRSGGWSPATQIFANISRAASRATSRRSSVTNLNTAEYVVTASSEEMIELDILRTSIHDQQLDISQTDDDHTPMSDTHPMMDSPPTAAAHGHTRYPSSSGSISLHA